MKTVGERLREWRKQNNLTMMEIQEKTGITQGALTKYENNKSMIGGMVLIKLYDYYKIDIQYILTGNPSNKTIELSENEKELLKNFDQLTEREQIKAIARLEDMVEKTLKNINIIDTNNGTINM